MNQRFWTQIWPGDDPLMALASSPLRDTGKTQPVAVVDTRDALWLAIFSVTGKLTFCHGKIHHAINGKIHYFNGHFQKRHKSVAHMVSNKGTEGIFVPFARVIFWTSTGECCSGGRGQFRRKQAELNSWVVWALQVSLKDCGNRDLNDFTLW